MCLSCLKHAVLIPRCRGLTCDVLAVKGAWSTWGTWADCSQSCDKGMTSRRRSCESVVVGLDFLPCNGDSTESKLCLLRPCPGEEEYYLFQLSTPMSSSLFCRSRITRLSGVDLGFD